MAESGAVLSETAAVYWRPRVDARRLQVTGRAWTASTFAHTVPWLLMAALLLLLGGLGAVLGFVWLGRARWVGVTGLALVVGVALLGLLAVRGILLG